MDEKKNGDKPKYEVPKNDIPTTIRKSQFSSDNKEKKTTLLGVPVPKEQGKRNG